ncbi:TIR domain-containing protein [Nocardia alni]|uniref:TIR domain-containing protein n=1 Tax=Nocardia alni TaxID=2815723 RepID=UPI001C21CD22|nr:TIR domain-containing protein [Nocardia alni]
MTGVWDVFLSYSRSDADSALRIGHALGAAGLRVFWDTAGVQPFQSISDTILAALGDAKVVLAYYSADYPARYACQHELTLGFLAGQREGDPRRRVLVVNPESTVEHIRPVELRDARHVSAPTRDIDYRRLAASVAEHVSTITETIAEITAPEPAHWLSVPAQPSATSFAGRFPQLWQLHSALHRHRARLTSRQGGRVAVVHGLTGIGKSRLVLEYVHLFQSAFPGGIGWLNADQDDPLPRLRSKRDRMARTMRLGTTRLDTGVARHPYLWVFDNIPPGLGIEDLRELFSLDNIGYTVVTSTDRRYIALGGAVTVGPLSPADAGVLLPIPWHHANPGVVDRVIDTASGHPEVLNILANADSAAAALGELHAGNPGLMHLAQRIVDAVDRSAEVDLRIVHDVLRAAAVLEPTPADLDHLAAVIGELHGLTTSTARRTVAAVVHLLITVSVIEPITNNRIQLSPLIGHLTRTLDSDAIRQAEIRSATLKLLPTTPARRRRRTPDSARLRRAAWALQVELAHRVSVLRRPEIGLRETLAPLYSLVEFVRSVLIDGGPEQHTRPVQEIGIALITGHLRPILTRWHPELLNYEFARPIDRDPYAYEREWIQADELRKALIGLRAPLTEMLRNLGKITGSDHGMMALGAGD